MWAIVSPFIGASVIIFMFSILIMYSEVFGYIVEVAFFTLMGAIVNAGKDKKILLFYYII